MTCLPCRLPTLAVVLNPSFLEHVDLLKQVSPRWPPFQPTLEETVTLQVSSSRSQQVDQTQLLLEGEPTTMSRSASTWELYQHLGPFMVIPPSCDHLQGTQRAGILKIITHNRMSRNLAPRVTSWLYQAVHSTLSGVWQPTDSSMVPPLQKQHWRLNESKPALRR